MKNSNKSKIQAHIFSSISVKSHLNSIKMAVKLFFITGIPWVLEIAAWVPMFLHSTLPNPQLKLISYVFEISNILNALRGVIIFVLFVLLQRDVRAQLLFRLSGLANNSSKRQKKDANSSLTTPKRTASSQLSSSSGTVNNSSSGIGSLGEDRSSIKGVEATSFEPDEVTVL